MKRFHRVYVDASFCPTLGSQIGYYIESCDGEVLIESSERIFRNVPRSSEAEYIALFAAIEKANDLNLTNVHFYMDCSGVVYDLKSSKYKNKNIGVTRIRNRILDIFKKNKWSIHNQIHWISRVFNERAHNLSRKFTEEYFHHPFLLSLRQSKKKEEIWHSFDEKIITLKYKNHEFKIAENIIHQFYHTNLLEHNESIKLLIHHLCLSNKQNINYSKSTFQYGSLIFTAQYNVIYRMERIDKRFRNRKSEHEKKRSEQILQTLNFKKMPSRKTS